MEITEENFASEVVALAKRATENMYPWSGKASKEWLSKVRRRAELYTSHHAFYYKKAMKATEEGRLWWGVDPQLRSTTRKQINVCFLVGPGEVVFPSEAKYRWLPEEGVWRVEWVEEVINPLTPVAALLERQNRLPSRVDEDLLWRVLGITVESDAKEVGTDMEVYPSEQDFVLLTVEDRNTLALRNGWCNYYHDGEQPLWWKGCLVHVSDSPRRSGDGYSHDRPFFQEGKEFYVVEARKPYNVELSHEEWDNLMSEMTLKYSELEYFSVTTRGTGWVDSAPSLIQFQKEMELDQLYLAYEEVENSWRTKESSRNSTSCYRKERRRALR